MTKNQPVIAFLGKRDEPTDGVEQYCRYLGQSLAFHQISLEIRRVPWDSRGWKESLNLIRSQVRSLPPETWFLLQYTALAWSSRGFPLRFLRVLRSLRALHAKTAVVFHDVEPFAGNRAVDRLRRLVQIQTMRRIVAYCSVAFFTVPLGRVSWLRSAGPNIHFVPVGPNLPIDDSPAHTGRQNNVPTIAIFGITGGDAGLREVNAIVASVRNASRSVGRLRLSVFGRNADVAEALLRESLKDVPVEVSVKGVLDELQLVEEFCASDLLLFVRGAISCRRGSAIAGIACGLPVIAFRGGETASPITEAGVVLVRQNSQDELDAALLHVLSDAAYRSELASRSRSAFRQHFCWPSIASRFASVLKNGDTLRISRPQNVVAEL